VPEALLAVTPKMAERLKYPDSLLSPRQKLVLSMIYDRDLEVAEIATSLGVDPQTVRSTHHKAMLKLRSYFAQDERQGLSGDDRTRNRLNN
jgi:RNA polymerase sigma-70 factor (ECF subfamily)